MNTKSTLQQNMVFTEEVKQSKGNYRPCCHSLISHFLAPQRTRQLGGKVGVFTETHLCLICMSKQSLLTLKSGLIKTFLTFCPFFRFFFVIYSHALLT